MTADAIWPAAILPPRQVTPEVVSATLDAGRTFTAIEDIDNSSAEFWQIIFADIPVASITQKRQWRATAALLGGRMGTCTVPIYAGQPAIACNARDGAAARATKIALRVTDGSLLEPGMMWSTTGASGDPRLYRIVDIDSTVAGMGHVDFTVDIWPPVRDSIAASQAVEFGDPRCLCMLLTDDEMFTGADDYAGRTTAKITWVEHK